MLRLSDEMCYARKADNQRVVCGSFDLFWPIRAQYSPDNISGGLILHGGVDKGNDGDVGHIADVGVD